MLHTRLCDLLGIEVPILVAPMGFVTGAELAAAVSNAGGLGLMSFNGNPPDVLRQEIRRLRGLTAKPFGVNLLLPFPQEENVAVCLEERVPVLSFFWGDPSPYVARAHGAGVKVFDQVGSVAAAERSARAGVDVIIAQGVEAGGHVAGEVGMAVLVPRVADAVAPTPVVAAGGIADGRGVAAALALGAVGVWMGTRFIATHEAYGHDNYKKKIVAIDEEGTVVHRGATGKPCRAVRNDFTREWEKRTADILPFPLQAQRVGFPAAIRAREDGDVENGHAACGQSAGLIQDILPARDVIERLVAEAEAALARRPIHH